MKKTFNPCLILANIKGEDQSVDIKLILNSTSKFMMSLAWLLSV